MNLDKGAERDVDESRVPENLKPLIPLVRKWAFVSLDDQDQFVVKMEKARPAETEEFARAVDAAAEAIHAWAKTLPFITKHLSERTAEDYSHPFSEFIRIAKCREAVKWRSPPTPDELEMQARLREERHVNHYKEATVKADEAFRRKDYAEYVHLLSSFDDLLTPTQRTKLSIARSKTDA